ncbi:hypothetical protein KGF56_000721 [Candida oxycetoniae]|uniref:amidase n=1 Tax=Candida oxycetoniae TaxID=497107 RepID=A0AAI9T0Z6_9ASCO|nr:uncharacterized protein KGF56_000721 [Candida oxycetoniae]KAI3406589.1 hypothetical protein KGF56_000721 [Candida oxycetoniae]
MATAQSEELYKSFLTKDDFFGYEDPEKYAKYIPKLEAYRQRLADAIPKELATTLPKPRDELIAEQFDAVDYLYKAKLLSPKEFEITDTPAATLLQNIASGKWTSVEVFKAFAKRAILAHQFTNCAMEFFVDEGLKRAEELDAYYKEHGKTMGPLHGMPISVKEHVAYKGKPLHACYVGLIDNIATEDSVGLQIMKKMGAVFYVRTSQPQTLMQLDSGNNFTGLTKNPFNLLLSSGGSSSGEGALVAFGGSVIGLGSDIGGSIRAPAAYSGCHGFRPTTRRISLMGGASALGGQESVPAVAGPFARTVDDIDLWMKHYINDGKPWDYDTWSIPMPWREVTKPNAKDITIAVIRDDGLVRPSPPIRRGLNEVVSKLKAAGVNVIEFTPPNTKLAYETINNMYTCDGNYKQREMLAESGEPLTKLTKWNLNFGQGSKHYTVYENRSLNVIRDELRTEYNDYMVKNKVDFILSPAYNNVAPHSEEVYNWSYTALFNILDLPTLAFQTGLRQDPELDVWTEEDKKHVYRSDLEQLENENYKPDEFKGAPIALQLSARRYFDEEVIGAGKLIVDDILKVDLLKQ